MQDRKEARFNLAGKLRGMSNRARMTVAGCGALALTSIASATGGGTPTLDAITFPIEPSSISSAIAVAGGTILALVIALSLGFVLINKFWRRASRSV